MALSFCTSPGFALRFYSLSARLLQISARTMPSSSLRRGVTPRIQTSLSSLDQVDAKTTEDKPQSPVPLSEYMWHHSLTLANEALETQFLHGIRHGSLHPERYGAYCVQDVAYCSNAVKDYDISIQKAVMPEVRDFLQKRRDGYQEYLLSSKEQWHIDDTKALVLNQAVQNYIDFERKVAVCRDPVYLVVAMIPCSRLWYWLANQMLAYEGATNVYSFWIRENRQGDGGKKLENFVNLHSSRLCKDTALKIYQGAIVCEANFMRSACDQVLAHFPDGLDEALAKAAQQ